MQQTKSKNVKKVILLLLLAFILPCLLFFGGCAEVYVSSIEYTGVNGNTSIYTVKYSDGKTSTIAVENGKDAEDITLQDIFQACVDEGIYNDGQYTDFLKAYVATNVKVEEDLTPTKLSIYSAMNTSVSIYTAFEVKDYYETTNKFSGMTIPHQYTGYEIYAGSGVVYKMGAEYSYIITNSHVVTCYTSTAANKLPEEIMIYPYGYQNETYYMKESKHCMSCDRNWVDNGQGACNYCGCEDYYYTAYDFNGGVNATCVGYSVDHDLALIRVKTTDLVAMNKDVCEVTFASDYSLLDEVYVIGNPGGFGISVTKGIVSVCSEEIEIDEMPADNQMHTFRVMRIDNAIYGGNSGGGLYNAKGEIVGIVNAGSNSGDNWSYALPVDMVVPCVKNLMDNSVRYSVKAFTAKDMGATLNDVYADYDEATGKLSYKVTVDSVASGSAFDVAGLKAGDIITGIIIDDNLDNGGKPYNITATYQIDDLLLNVRANSKLTFKVTRGSLQNQTIDVNTNIVNSLLK